MSFGGIDYDADELNELHRRYEIGDRIINKDIYISKTISPVICYSHIDLSGSEYSFNKVEFKEDVCLYLEKIKALCDNSIEELLNKDTKREWHLFPTRGKKIITELKRHFDVKKIDQDRVPEIYHFALYTDQDKADKETGKRSPRIHFIVGNHGMLYPLFYDPYHEINSMPENR